MNTALVIMAAGMASRFGGNKQTTGMGPHGETLMEYSICDALRAGFDKVVFIIRPEMLDLVKGLCGDRIARRAEVRYAFQDFGSLPAWYKVPEGRVKPFGTVHAVLSAKSVIDEPFAVINADDYYGVESFGIMHEFLAGLDDPARAAMMGYRLRNTVSLHGDVTRGICNIKEGRLTTVDEVQKIRLYPDGRIADVSAGEPGRELDGMSPVSMNFWGFHPGALQAFESDFEAFLRNIQPGDVKAEYVLPVMVDRLVREGRMSVEVLHTDAAWFGVTYQEDRPLVQQALKALHDRGVYGERL